MRRRTRKNWTSLLQRLLQLSKSQVMKTVDKPAAKAARKQQKQQEESEEESEEEDEEELDEPSAKAAPAEQESSDEDCRQTCGKGCPKAAEADGHLGGSSYISAPCHRKVIQEGNIEKWLVMAINCCEATIVHFTRAASEKGWKKWRSMASDVLKAAMCCNVVRLVPLDSRFPPAQQQLRLDADVNTALSLPVISWSNELRVA